MMTEFNIKIGLSLPKLGSLFFASSKSSHCLLSILISLVVLCTFVYYSVKEAYMVVSTGVCTAFILFSPVWRYHNPETVIYQVHLDLAIDLGSC
jgi:hypothetical protein